MEWKATIFLCGASTREGVGYQGVEGGGGGRRGGAFRVHALGRRFRPLVYSLSTLGAGRAAGPATAAAHVASFSEIEC
jgi:hypothetical protein